MRKLLLHLTITLFAFASNAGVLPQGKSWQLPARVTSGDYEANVVVVKLKPLYRDEFSDGNASPATQKALSDIQASRPEKVFPNHTAPDQARNLQGQPLVDLTLVYRLRYQSSADIAKIINILLATGLFEYAEPVYLAVPFYVPNDTMVLQQWDHSLLQSFAAWDIQKGDSNVVIGITDTGIDTLHPDLKGKIRYNTADPVNGIDDDSDGFIDNYYGWNVATNSYDVARNELHGAFVSGIAAAGTDNVTGIAGIAFRCKFFPVACSSSPSLNVIANGDLAIQYAADHGASIINCSWGGFGNSQFSQDMVNYATFNRNALVVAAAGNSQNDDPFFPASYEHVLSVAAIDSFNVKWSGSSYGSYVDITSQGDRVLSVWPGGGYGFSGGTSEACPQVSGAAALVKSQFPTLTALQIGERLRATSDNTDTIPGNAAYIRKLGKGRLNIFRALTEPAKSLRAESIHLSDSNDGNFSIGDTLRISALFVNYLDALTNGTVQLTCNSPFLTILNPSLMLGSMSTLQADSNRTNPFLAVINPGTPLNSLIVFTFDFQDGSYSDWQSFELTVNVDYINILENDIGITMTSKGKLGFNDASSTQGIGFTYNDGPNLLYGGSFLVGVNDSMISDATFGSPTGQQDTDFVPIEYIHEVSPPVVSNYDATTLFNDSGSTRPIGVEVRHHTYAWSSPADRKYIICEYILKNTTGSTLNTVHAGLYCDWDITSATYANNRCSFDTLNRMGYQFFLTNNNQYVGIKLLTAGSPNYYAFDNDGAGGTINIYDGFTKAEKFQSLSTLSKHTAGTAPTGNDASMMFGTGPFTIAPSDSVIVAFALLAGDSLADLTQGATAAQLKYDNIGAGIHGPEAVRAWCSVFPNPASREFTINLFSPVPATASIRMNDITGRLVWQSEKDLVGGVPEQKLVTGRFPAGTYLLDIRIGDTKFIQKIIIQ